MDPAYWGRALRVLLLSATTTPLAVLESILYRRKIQEHQLAEPPVFILGHWRSGTTHLHNLLTQDPAFGVLTYFQAYFQNVALLNLSLHRRMLAMILPPERPMDHMALGIDLPAEEEFALACLDDVAIINGLWFPKHLLNYLRETVLFEDEHGVKQDDLRQRWQRAYRTVISRTSMALGSQHRCLLLKNPANTGRVAAMLELYPKARFIHIYRNPYLVFPSTLRLYRELMALGAFQNVAFSHIEESVLKIYTQVMARYEAERKLIPPRQLVEVRYEDLDARPMETLSTIYSRLNLSDFESVQPAFNAYIEQQRGYRKNTHTIDAALIERVDKHWGAWVERWGYRVPGEHTNQ